MPTSSDSVLKIQLGSKYTYRSDASAWTCSILLVDKFYIVVPEIRPPKSRQ
jgi:hypothetical protein